MAKGQIRDFFLERVDLRLPQVETDSKLFRNRKKLHVGTKKNRNIVLIVSCGNSETVLWQVGKKVDLRQPQVGKTE